jgi:hypothetical protein
MSAREKTGAREIHLAASDERNSGVDTRVAFYVAGRDRLAASSSQPRSADGGVRPKIFANFVCVFIML